MKILLLSTADPGDFSSGGNQRSNYIREALLRIAQVDTIVVNQEEPSTIRTDWGSERVLKVSTALYASRWEKIKHRAVAQRMIAVAEASNDYDFIVARYFRTAVLVPVRAHRKLIIDGDDLQQTGFGQPLSRRIFVRVRAALIRIIAKRAFHVWLVDPRDRATLPRTRLSMLPNTAKRLHEAAPSSPGNGRRIMMVGLYPYPPNEAGLIWFAREVLPDIEAKFPNVELHAVGRYYKQSLNELGNRVRMRGFVDDLKAEYLQADIVICPVYSGSGTQIKIVEALMSGRPTVVSDFSYQGFSDVLKPYDHILVAHDRQEWVRHITAVLDNPSNFFQMADEGRKVAEITYSVDAFFERVAQTLKQSGDKLL